MKADEEYLDLDLRESALAIRERDLEKTLLGYEAERKRDAEMLLKFQLELAVYKDVLRGLLDRLVPR